MFKRRGRPSLLGGVRPTGPLVLWEMLRDMVVLHLQGDDRLERRVGTGPGDDYQLRIVTVQREQCEASHLLHSWISHGGKFTYTRSVHSTEGTHILYSIQHMLTPDYPNHRCICICTTTLLTTSWLYGLSMPLPKYSNLNLTGMIYTCENPASCSH